MPSFETTSEEDTARLAATIAAAAKSGEVFLLDGPLGAGKSVFARAFIRTLCGAETDVPSPTFTLVQTYEAQKGPVWHFDLYRLKDPEEIYEIGWEESANAIRLIEWPERLGPYTPKAARHITIQPTGEHSRKISIDDL